MLRKSLERIAGLHGFFVHGVRFATFLVMLWIGGLKFVPYEADGIVPFVANSPAMSFFYAHPAPDYRAHMNKEGELVPQNRAWHESNHTYAFSRGLGAVIIGIGTLLLLGTVKPKVGFVGAALTVGMSFVTLSFLVTTPETWVPKLGAGTAGFPYLSGAGRLVLKDVIMMAGGLVCLSDSARRWLGQKTTRIPSTCSLRLVGSVGRFAVRSTDAPATSDSRTTHC